MEDGFSLPTFHPKAKIILRGDPDFKVNAYQYATSSNNGMYPSTIIYPFELEDIFKTVDHAKLHNIGIAIRTGGHQYCGRKSRNLILIIINEICMLDDTLFLRNYTTNFAHLLIYGVP